MKRLITATAAAALLGGGIAISGVTPAQAASYTYDCTYSYQLYGYSGSGSFSFTSRYFLGASFSINDAPYYTLSCSEV